MLDDHVDSLGNSSNIKPLAMSRRVVMPSGNIPNSEENASGLEEDGDFLDNGPQKQQQHGSEEVNDNKDIRILAICGKKIVIILASTKSTVGKLLTMSIKVALMKDGQDMNIKKIWI